MDGPVRLEQVHQGTTQPIFVRAIAFMGENIEIQKYLHPSAEVIRALNSALTLAFTNLFEIFLQDVKSGSNLNTLNVFLKLDHKMR